MVEMKVVAYLKILQDIYPCSFNVKQKKKIVRNMRGVGSCMDNKWD